MEAVKSRILTKIKMRVRVFFEGWIRIRMFSCFNFIVFYMERKSQGSILLCQNLSVGFLRSDPDLGTRIRKHALINPNNYIDFSIEKRQGSILLGRNMVESGIGVF